MGRRMAGRFAVLPHEVIDVLLQLGPYATYFYVSLLRWQRIEEDWEAEGAWVTGTFATTKIDMVEISGVSRSRFWARGLWAAMLESTLILDNEDGTYTLTKLRKKIDVGITPAEVKEHGERIEKLEDKVFGGEPESGELELTPAGVGEEVHGGPHEVHGGPHEAHSEPAPARASEDLKKEDIDKRERGGKSNSTARQKTDSEPGTEDWVKNRVVALWPTRGYQPHRDDEFVKRVVKFSVASQQEAFDAAKDEPIQAGAWGWIMNRLENPDKYRGEARGSDVADRVAEMLGLEEE